MFFYSVAEKATWVVCTALVVAAVAVVIVVVVVAATGDVVFVLDVCVGPRPAWWS